LIEKENVLNFVGVESPAMTTLQFDTVVTDEPAGSVGAAARRGQQPQQE
jgi:hypothetical protein